MPSGFCKPGEKSKGSPSLFPEFGQASEGVAHEYQVSDSQAISGVN